MQLKSLFFSDQLSKVIQKKTKETDWIKPDLQSCKRERILKIFDKEDFTVVDF